MNKRWRLLYFEAIRGATLVALVASAWNHSTIPAIINAIGFVAANEMIHEARNRYRGR